MLGFRKFENLYIKVNSLFHLNLKIILTDEDVKCNFLKIKIIKKLLNYKRFRALFPFY